MLSPEDEFADYETWDAGYLASVDYAKGVPMGADLKQADGKKAPSFLVSALRDPQLVGQERAYTSPIWYSPK